MPDTYTIEMTPFAVDAANFEKNGVKDWKLKTDYLDSFFPAMFIRKIPEGGGQPVIFAFSDENFSKNIIASFPLQGGGKKHRKSMKRIKQIRK